MRYCNQHGIAHSTFLRWDKHDQSKALATLIEEARRCNLCGTADWEWEEDPHAYDVVENVCYGCERKETIEQDSTRRHLPGRFLTLERAEE